MNRPPSPDRAPSAESAGAHFVARPAPHLTATLTDLVPLRFDAPTPDLDLPGWVRGASAVRPWRGGLVVVQDDVLALARLDPHTGACSALPLPAGVDGRRTFGEDTGNKQHKLDLEAAVTLPDGRLVLWGSGSRPARERLVVLAPDGSVRVVPAADLYAGLHARAEFSGAELNLEGCALLARGLRLFQRGNGAAVGSRLPVDATADLDLGAFLAWLDAGGPPPSPSAVCTYDLGQVGGVRFGFTDATALGCGRIAFLAGAEDSPDVYRDGAVSGCRFGVILADGSACFSEVRDPSGALVSLKLEGLCLLDGSGSVAEGGSVRFAVVADLDDATRPSLAGFLTVGGV